MQHACNIFVQHEKYNKESTARKVQPQKTEKFEQVKVVKINQEMRKLKKDNVSTIQSNMTRIQSI